MAKSTYSTYLSVKNQLFELFQMEAFENNKLPSEQVLSKQLGISLVTLRESLMMLAMEGYITKIHGHGNFIHPSALEYNSPGYYFSEYLARNGHTPSLLLLSLDKVLVDDDTAKHLNLEPDEEILLNKMIHFADKNPAVFSYGHLPTKLLVREDVQNIDFSVLHPLARKYMNRKLAHSIIDYYPVAASQSVSARLKLPVGTPIIASKQVFYDEKDVPVIYNHHFFSPEYYNVRTLQNWALSDD